MASRTYRVEVEETVTRRRTVVVTVEEKPGDFTHDRAEWAALTSPEGITAETTSTNWSAPEVSTEVTSSSEVRPQGPENESAAARARVQVRRAIRVGAIR